MHTTARCMRDTLEHLGYECIAIKTVRQTADKMQAPDTRGGLYPSENTHPTEARDLSNFAKLTTKKATPEAIIAIWKSLRHRKTVSQNSPGYQCFAICYTRR